MKVGIFECVQCQHQEEVGVYPDDPDLADTVPKTGELFEFVCPCCGCDTAIYKGLKEGSEE